MLHRKLLLIAAVGFCGLARADLSSDVDGSLGYSSLNIAIDGEQVATLESLSTIDLNYNLNVNSIDSALNLSMQEFVSSNLGNLVYTRIGLGLRWYILGTMGHRMILDNQVQGRVWSPSPFFGLTMGITNLSLSLDDTGDFNANVVDAQVSMGAEIPILVNWIFVSRISGITSVISNSAGGGAHSEGASLAEESLVITYSGLQIFFGMKVTPF